MPRLWTVSDLHLEVARFDWTPTPPADGFDVLVVAGDVYEGDVARGIEWTARVAAGRPSVFVAGNHEFWGRTVEDEMEAAEAAARRTGVTFLDGQGWVEVGGVNFVGCTLWTDQVLAQPDGVRFYAREFGEPIDMRGAGIDRRAKARDMVRLHEKDLLALRTALDGPDAPPEGPKVVVTHHAPHPDCVAPAFRDRPGAAISASDLSALTDIGVADLWIHGHVHHSLDFVPGYGTRIVCNPLGVHGSNASFKDDFVVEVDPPAYRVGI